MSAGSSVSVLRWWWVRHAPTIGDPRVLQAADVPADLSNASAFRTLARALPADALWLTSGLRRAVDTCGALRRENPAIPEPRTEPDLGEQTFGAWTGRTWETIPEDLQDDFWADAVNGTPPGGESFADVFARVSRRVRAVSEELGEGDVVAIAHSGPIRAALAMTFGDDLQRALRLEVPHWSLTRIDADVCRGDRRMITSFRQA